MRKNEKFKEKVTWAKQSKERIAKEKLRKKRKLKIEKKIFLKVQERRKIKGMIENMNEKLKKEK